MYLGGWYGYCSMFVCDLLVWLFARVLMRCGLMGCLCDLCMSLVVAVYCVCFRLFVLMCCLLLIVLIIVCILYLLVIACGWRFRGRYLFHVVLLVCSFVGCCLMVVGWVFAIRPRWFDGFGLLVDFVRLVGLAIVVVRVWSIWVVSWWFLVGG